MRWDTAEPVLIATYELLNEDDEGTTPDAVCAAMGKPSGDEGIIRALALLYEQDYIDGMTVDNTPAPIFIHPTEKGLQHTSGWPSDRAGDHHVELLLKLLDERIDDDATPEDDKTKLRKVRDSITGMGRDVAVGLLTAFATQSTGLGGGG